MTFLTDTYASTAILINFPQLALPSKCLPLRAPVFLLFLTSYRPRALLLYILVTAATHIHGPLVVDPGTNPSQVVASHGRTFTGCWLSTFTAYILRLRGHLQKPRT